MIEKAGITIAISLMAIATPARACEWDPFLFQLPGETVAQANERSEKIHDEFEIIGDYNRQTSAYQKAKAIYLARTIGGKPMDNSYEVAATVRPIHALKGVMPRGDRPLIGQPAGGLCWDRGDGRGAFTKVGELVVVFEGVPKTEDRPRGIDSFGATSIRVVELLDKLRNFGKDLEGEQ